MKTIQNIDTVQGEFPSHDLDGRNTSKQMAKVIRKRVLEGAYPPEGSREEKMLVDFRRSGLSIAKFTRLLDSGKV